MKIIPLLRRYELLLQRTIWVYKMTGLTTGGQSSRLEKKLTINSWKRHALCDSVCVKLRKELLKIWTRYKE